MTTRCGGIFIIGNDFRHLRKEPVRNECISPQLMYGDDFSAFIAGGEFASMLVFFSQY